MLSLRAKVFITVSIIVLMILSISLVIIVSRRSAKQNNQPTPTTTAPNGDTTVIDQSNFDPGLLQPTATVTIPAGIPIKPLTTLEAEQHGVEQLAKVFVERYGTYSSENNFQNIREVETLCTRSFWEKISAIMKTPRKNQPFVGVTTRVISTALKTWSQTKADVELRTIRTEEKDGTTSTKQQTVTVSLVKIGSNWLVDGMVTK